MNLCAYAELVGISPQAAKKHAVKGTWCDATGRTWRATQGRKGAWDIRPADAPPEPSALDTAAAGDHIDVDTENSQAPALDLGILKAKLTLEQIRQLQARNAIRRQRLLKDWSGCLERAARSYYAALSGAFVALRLDPATAAAIDEIVSHSAGQLEAKLQAELDAYESQNSDKIE